MEDEDEVLQMTRLMLEKSGYRVLASSYPANAIDMAKEHEGEIHLLITDVIMPAMNGRILAENIEALFPHIKCLFMSGYTDNVIAHHGVLDKGVHFIQKPFSFQTLTTRIREVLDTGQILFVILPALPGNSTISPPCS